MMQELIQRELIKWGLIVVIAVVVVATIAFFVGRGCSPEPVILKDVPTDVNTTEIDIDANTKITEADREAIRVIIELEKRHLEELRQFNAEQEEKYRHIRELGPEAVVDWLRDFNEKLEEEKTCSEPF